MAKSNETRTVGGPGENPLAPPEKHPEKPSEPLPPVLTVAEQQAAKIAELEAKLAEKDDGRKTARGLTPSIQALATIDTALRKLKGEDAAAVQRVVAWIAQEWLPPNVVKTDKPGG